MLMAMVTVPVVVAVWAMVRKIRSKMH